MSRTVTVPSEAPSDAANSTGALCHVQRANALTACAAPAVQRDYAIISVRDVLIAARVMLIGRGDFGVTEYRAYVVGCDDHFTGFEPLVCADDAEAIEKAKRLINIHDIELWSGERLVIRLSATKQHGDAVTHEVKDGRLVPKSVK
jgi:hypothetical protein